VVRISQLASFVIFLFCLIILLGSFSFLATLIVVIGGVMFFAAVGDPAKIGKATSLLTAVAIGLVIIYGAWLLINLFFSLIGVAEWTELKEGWFKIDCPI
jgi:predicted signal transduction protein with EAL and GGDEF domain